MPENTDDQKTFNAPRLALNRIYTKRGDAGETSLAGGQRNAPPPAPRACSRGERSPHPGTANCCIARSSAPTGAKRPPGRRVGVGA